uniref:Reverse transcriptase domain-containing protein n=1 Tax=Cannabis sativa TaxID=3483 RepID=A0A803NP78_CANSA
MASSSHVEEIEERWKNIQLAEEEDDEVFYGDNIEEDVAEESIDTRWCLVGRLLTGKVSDFRVFQNFYHEVDIHRVITGSPWTYDRKQIVIARLKDGDNPRTLSLNTIDLWVQVHDLQSGFFTMKVVRVTLSLDKPLKRRMKFRKRDGESFYAVFKYDSLVKPYGIGMKATPRRHQQVASSPFLRSGRATTDFVPEVNPSNRGDDFATKSATTPKSNPAFNLAKSHPKQKGIVIYDNQEEDEELINAELKRKRFAIDKSNPVILGQNLIRGHGIEISSSGSVSDTVIAVRDKLRGKIGQTKVKRYWPGKAPEWADDAEEEGDIRMSKAAALEKAFPTQEYSETVRKDDPRLRRLAESRIDNREEVRADHRRIRQAEIVSTIEEEARRQEGLDAEEDDADALEERRRRIKERLHDEPTGIAMLKPVFVPKSERDTVAERERLEAEELAVEELKKKKLEERKRETKKIVVEEIRKDEEIQKSLEQEANIADIDTDDEINEAEEYEAWKKYFHKGAFFQSESDDHTATAGPDGIYTRDYSAPTGEDKMDKTILPKVMQVKHFGRSGRTKWTHLVNEDTTDWNNPWTYNDPLRAKYNAKMAGMNAPIAKPKGSKKLKDWESLNGIRRSVTTEQNDALLQLVSSKEVKQSLFQMHPDKAPRPDGMGPDFYQIHWDTVGFDIVQLVTDFFVTENLLLGLNDTHLVLIPKKKHFSTMGDLRPIALCNVSYKILSKVLANRMRDLIDHVISPTQSAFIPGRLVSNNIMIAFEIMHYLKRKTKGKKEFMAMKLDMSKAYDRVEWDYLRVVMHRMGFAGKWINLIMKCVNSVQYSIIHNGHIMGPITRSCGIRQVAICQATSSTAAEVNQMLHSFELAFGQKVNATKSSIFFSPNTEATQRHQICTTLGMTEANDSFLYLGSPNIICRRKTVILGFLKNKIINRINSWNGKFLSRAGKEILLKTVIQSLQTYAMSVFLIPLETYHEIEKIMENFWWKTTNAKGQGIIWMSWDRMATHKYSGGMGFRHLHDFNLAVLAKQGWNLLCSPSSLASRLYKAKYYPQTDYLNAKLGHNPSFVWHSIWSA